MMTRTTIGLTMLIAMSAGTVWGQERPPLIVPAPVQPGRAPTPPIGFPIGVLSVEPVEMGEPVEHAPYSADIVNEVRQVLADGNRIERRSTGTVARDSRGRVRREQPLAAIGPVVPSGDARMVTIADPVARVHYSLDPVRKVAAWSRPRAHTGPNLIAPGPLIAGADPVAPSEPQAQRTRVEQLGAKELEGVRAEGTRTTTTVPAAAIGNVQPIEIVSERWYSPELRVVLFSRRFDPRFGETIYRLTNITRAEPHASLFQVPSDYTREELKPFLQEPADPKIVKPLP